MQLREHFDGVAGSSMGHERRDKSSIIAHALNKFELDPACSMMIGDRGQDIAGARDNGLGSIAVSYGFGSMEELRAAGPDHIVGRATEIATILVPV
jgi:phosphoglycolate phosphatase